MRRAFSMLELVFVIVIIGILSSVAIQKFAINRDDAVVVTARNTVAAVRSALTTQRQKRVLSGDNTPITSLDSGNADQPDSPIFDHFDDSNATDEILAYPLRTCKNSTARGCWIKESGQYVYRWPIGTDDVVFTLNNGKFDCDHTDDLCRRLTE